jgi:rhodanese-related sulfurtransferase
MLKEMTPREFLERRTAGAALTLVDVREDWETTLAPVPADHLHIPMGQIAERLAELNPADETVVICRSGGRSLEVARFLSTHGFVSVYNLAGGILAWSRDLDPRIPQY